MITIIYHSADYDGIFCREIAKKFLRDKDVEYIGWDHGNPVIPFPNEGIVYVLDLPADRPFGLNFSQEIPSDIKSRLIWIDHHASAINNTNKDINGYRIDGVAACRLMWQWFSNQDKQSLPKLEQYKSRSVREPFGVRLAGEYDVWDHRGDGSFELQFGLDSVSEIYWECLLDCSVEGDNYASEISYTGEDIMKCFKKRDTDIVNSRSYIQEFEGLKFLTLNTAKCNSMTFAAKDKPETGHDAIMAFFWNGKAWKFSLYHASHNKEVDILGIAQKYGGGGHRGACGFEVKTLPF